MQQVLWLRIGEGDQYRGNCTTEEDDEDNEEEDRGKMVQAGNRFHATQAGN